MKTINVVAAILEKEDKILIARRLKGEFEGLWEFPGGKVESGETQEEAIIREIQEEFEVSIEVKKYLTTVEHDYPNFHLSMACFVCSLKSEALHLNDHSAVKWINPSVENIEWVPADIKVMESYKEYINGQFI